MFSGILLRMKTILNNLVATFQVYRYSSHARFRGRTLVQLNYLFWFPARDTSDIYSGHLDAVIWRVTLDEQGVPLAYDSIHGCGCYYQLFPRPGYQLRPLPPGEEPVLIPVSAPVRDPGQRLVLRLAQGPTICRRFIQVGRP
jgi:hypothetical protein